MLYNVNMPLVELRLKANTKSPGDLIVSVQDKTFEFLNTTTNKEIRVSAYLDRNWPRVETRYQELFISDVLKFQVSALIPGSKTRKVTLPGEMLEGEQLVITVKKE
jgi:hypothetical protein